MSDLRVCFGIASFTSFVHHEKPASFRTLRKS